MCQLRFLFFIFFVLAFFPLGCTTITLNININDIGNYPEPLMEPLPINVGVLYGNDFRTYKTTQENDYTDGVTRISKIQLGKANTALFDYILSHNFKNVTTIQHLPNEPETLKNIDLILEPTIFNYIYSERKVIFEPAAIVKLKYQINFYLPNGVKISWWLISGESSRYVTAHGVEVMSGHSYSVELTQLAMRKVATQFFADFCKQRDIKKIFDKQCSQ
jgi:hypothetical protein